MVLCCLSQAYAGNYSGNARINRMIFIADKTTDSALALSALKIAADDLKKVRDVETDCELSFVPIA